MAEQPAKEKRHYISKAQRMTLLEVLITSVILGACVVLSNFLIKYINFNTKIITEKDAAIADYNSTMIQVGVCKDDNRDGKLSDKELKACDPDSVSLNDVPNSLRYNIYETMASNEDLELVARRRKVGGVCYDDNKKEINFTARYNQAKTDEERAQALLGMRECSSLRVIYDALPEKRNTEALMSSLNELFIEAQIEPESIAPRDEIVAAAVDGVSVIPVTFRMNGSGADVIRILDAVERSIRTFDITSGVFQWSSSGINMRAEAEAYYLDESLALETKKTVRAAEGEKK